MDAFSTGNVLSSDALESVRHTWQYAMNHHGHGMVAQHIGRAYNSAISNDTQNFRIITPVTTPIDTSVTTRPLGVIVQCWGGSADFEVFWNGVSQDTQGGAGSGQSTATTVESIPAGPSWEGVVHSPQTSLSNEYRFDTLRVDGPPVASISVFSVPENSLTDAAALGVVDGNFQANVPLKGCKPTPSFTDRASVDVIAQYQNSVSSTTTQSIISNSSRCLAYHCHGYGNFNNNPAGGGSLGYTGLIGGLSTTGAYTSLVPSWKVRPRNLTELSYPSDTIPCDIGVYARGDTNSVLRFQSVNTGSTVDISMTSTSYSFYTDIGNLDIDPGGDEILVKCYSSTTIAIETQAFAIWEPQSGTVV
jgi:hypothetical protein